jgi:hypothetical protein
MPVQLVIVSDATARLDTTKAPITKHQISIALIETRTYTVIHDVDLLQDNHEWPGLKSVVMVESEREIPATAKDRARIEHETRFYITSLVWLASQIAPAIRGHWMSRVDEDVTALAPHSAGRAQFGHPVPRA